MVSPAQEHPELSDVNERGIWSALRRILEDDERLRMQPSLLTTKQILQKPASDVVRYLPHP
jgi:hypothetical protein